MSQQPEALRLAKELDRWVDEFSGKAADLLRNQHAEIERLRAELEALHKQEPALYVQCNHVSQAKYAPFLARICQQPIDNIATTPFYAAAGAQPALGWLRAIDEAIVCSRLGTAEATDDYATAKRKLNELICWNVAVEKELCAQPAPSGLETRMYQDAEGKRPVTGVNQPVGLVRQSWVPKRKPLTEPEIFKAYTTLTGKRLPYIGSSRAELIAVVRMTEAAHGIKENNNDRSR